ncbi:response regulator transcription factor [Paenibacillus sp. y28]|uniref:response regulator transcription factor n=1 Tax=Paenibacillus sp. y28 TaxID=3129110 RepID=UPI0030193F74
MYKLVLVDDEAEIRSGLSQYFPWGQIGFTIVGSFENGLQALEYIEAHPVDVLLCDVTMPVMTGLELARRLRENGSRIKILFLSGHKDFEYAKQALAYDVKSYIVKPTHYDELVEEFTRLKLELDKTAPDSAGGEGGGQASFDEKIIAAIKSYVEQNYRNAGLEQAAALVRMNPDYISKYFKQKTGQNFSDYVVDIRMAKAAELLRDIRYKTFEISELVGYSYPKNFTRTFKKYYGVSPREFRSGREAASRLEADEAGLGRAAE